MLRPIRERREYYLSDKTELIAILKQGTDKARDESEAVLDDVKRAFGLNFF